MCSVPQGTVLAPLLFLLLEYDIDTSTQYNCLLSFVDDMGSRMVILTDDTENLQTDIKPR